MERYLAYILNLVAEGNTASLQPLYGVTGTRDTTERIVDTLPGYRGMGPVRTGTRAWTASADPDASVAAASAPTTACLFSLRIIFTLQLHKPAFGDDVGRPRRGTKVSFASTRRV